MGRITHHGSILVDCIDHKSNSYRLSINWTGNAKRYRNIEETKMKKPLCFVMLVLTTGPALAASPSPVADTQYKYGMHLDIAEVISVTATPVKDADYPATMEYIDHQGQTERLSYIVTDTTWGGK
jgi:hypothetical protein